MKKLIVFLLFFTASGCDLNRPEGSIPDGLIYQKLFGQPNSAEWMTSMSPLKDGGYIITGSTDGLGFGQQNALLMKIDPGGNLVWQKSYGVDGENESGRKVVETMDGGYLFIGNTSAKGAGNSDMYLVKTGSDGTVLWDKTYGTPAGDYGYDILPVDDGYLLLGNTNNTNSGYSDFFVVRVDLDGNLLWSSNYGTDNVDIAKGLIALKDGNVILGGYTWGNADYIDIYLIKISPAGDFIWEMRYDGPQELGASGDFVGKMQPTADGGFIVAGTQGYINATGFSGLAWILKLSVNGTLEWDKTFGIVNGVDDAQAAAVAVLNDGYIVVGTKLNSDDETDFYLVRTDLSGNTLWEKTIDQSSSDQGRDIAVQDEIFTLAGIGYELEKWYQVFLYSFKNTPD